jgi:hypothetical protein
VLTIIGAFVAAPFGGLLWAFGACGLRIGALYILSRVKGHRFDALDRPVPRVTSVDNYEESERVLEHTSDTKAGKFF